MNDLNYILDVNGEPVVEHDLLAWGRWMQVGNRVVRRTRVLGATKAEDCEVSTVFLALNHNFSQSGPPVLWETMIFGGSLDGEQWRYTSRAEAITDHERIIESMRVGRNPCNDDNAPPPVGRKIIL